MSGMQPADAFFNHEDFSDILLVIRQDDVMPDTPSPKRARQPFAAGLADKCLFGHSIMLARASTVWHRELKAWSDDAPVDGANRKVRLACAVPAGACEHAAVDVDAAAGACTTHMNNGY